MVFESAFQRLQPVCDQISCGTGKTSTWWHFRGFVLSVSRRWCGVSSQGEEWKRARGREDTRERERPAAQGYQLHRCDAIARPCMQQKPRTEAQLHRKVCVFWGKSYKQNIQHELVMLQPSWDCCFTWAVGGWPGWGCSAARCPLTMGICTWRVIYCKDGVRVPAAAVTVGAAEYLGDLDNIPIKYVGMKELKYHRLVFSLLICRTFCQVLSFRSCAPLTPKT